MTAKLVTIYWRDIPTQVNAQSGRTRHAAPLHRRFMRAVDKAAMVAGLTDAHEYVKQWRRTDRPCSDDLEAEALAEVARLDADFPRARLIRLAQSGGFLADMPHDAAASVNDPAANEADDPAPLDDLESDDELD